uniref:GmrSD restriction endonuclease domain-containing protein n=1 Tax=Anaerotignum sp. TaxID=2039241 RepID=UPI003734E237
YVGYIITWKNPDVKTKDGGKANGKKVLIDGQQRVTALMAAISGKEVLDDDFNKERIKIAFNPLAEDETKRFAVQDASHLKDKKWIPDISVVFEPEFDPFEFSIRYCEDNEGVKPNVVNNAVMELRSIANRQIGVIELDASLEIDEVTEIFIRINSKGAALSQSDFVMSKMAADTDHNGSLMRKTVDYFCHLAVKPDFYSQMIKDQEFQDSKYAAKIKWLANDYDDIYDPNFGDMLRVSFMHQFRRGKLADLVSLLSGRDFITKEYRDDIIDDSYQKLDQGIMNFINQYHFSQFVMAIKGAGFVSSKQLNSQMTLDFAYTLYLMLLDDPEIPNAQIKRYVQKWFVLSTLTSRYIGSPESQMDRDMRSIGEKGFLKFLSEIEASALSETFWTVTLPQNLETSSVNSPAFNTFLAAQINQNCNSMLMNGTKIADLITISGDVHHIFPKNYLQKNGIKSKTKYNQVANYIYLDTQVNKAISDEAPAVYFAKVKEQCQTKNVVFGNIMSDTLLKTNLAENCIPNNVDQMTFENYDEFLQKRRMLMADMIHQYYMGL